jgi:regulator of protease activity HflC (stomatin/prohibitin superfamily)
MLFSESVPAGTVGVRDEFGRVSEQEYEPGIFFVAPWVDIVPMSTKIQKATFSDLVGISQDSQEITTEVIVNYRLTPAKASDMYSQVGKDYIETIGYPIIVAIVKSDLAKYQATDFAKNWEPIKASVSTQVTERLLESGIIVTEVSLTDFDFTAQFNAAIEAKVTAEQRALEAVNKKQQTITEAQARAEAVRLDADAQAYSTKTKADSESYALRVVREELQQSNKLIDYTLANKWDGQLPKITSTDGMLLTLPSTEVTQ